MTLTADQRWLLAGWGGWMCADALLGEGITGMGGSSSGIVTRTQLDYPDWLRQGYGYQEGIITSPWLSRGNTRQVKVTNAQLARFAADIPPAAIERLRVVRDAHRTEEHSALDWCLCGKTPCVSTTWGGVYTERRHPTDTDYRTHIERKRRLAYELQAAIEHALGLDAGQQLDLFGEAS